MLGDGELDGIERAFAIHCDPKIEVGQVGFLAGPITAGADRITVSLSGPGGHTARPHLTADLVYALGAVVTELPALLSRRADPRSGLSLVWGQVHAGAAANAIPQDRLRRGHGPLPRRRHLGGIPRPGAGAGQGAGGAVRCRCRRGRAHLRTAVRQRRGRDRADPQRRVRRARSGVDHDHRPEPRRRGLRLDSRPGSGRFGPAWGPPHGCCRRWRPPPGNI